MLIILGWVENNYINDALICGLYGLDGTTRTKAEYITAMNQLATSQKIERLYFDNILIRDNLAALHYRYRSEDLTNHEKSVGDRMQFLKFKEEGSVYKIEGSWIK
jgi:hypothetical protein